MGVLENDVSGDLGGESSSGPASSTHSPTPTTNNGHAHNDPAVSPPSGREKSYVSVNILPGASNELPPAFNKALYSASKKQSDFFDEVDLELKPRHKRDTSISSEDSGNNNEHPGKRKKKQIYESDDSLSGDGGSEKSEPESELDKIPSVPFYKLVSQRKLLRCKAVF